VENIVVVKCNAELLRSLGMKTWRIAPTWCALLYWPKIYVALKDTGQNLNKRHIRLMQKLKFSGIPDTRNTRWFWKKIGSGSGIDKNFGFGSGIGYPLGPDSQMSQMPQTSLLISLIKCLKGHKSLESLCSVVKTLIVSLVRPSKQGTDNESYWAVLDS